MHFINQLSEFYKTFFSFMWLVLKGPLSFSFSMTFDRSNHSSIVNALGGLSFLFTIPYTLMIGLPVGVTGLVLGALSAPISYFIAGVMDLVSSFIPDFEGRSELKIDDFSEAENNEPAFDELVTMDSTASISYMQGVRYFNELRESQKARGSKDPSACTSSEIELSRNAKRFLKAASAEYQKLSTIQHNFFNFSQNAEVKLADCNDKLKSLHF